MAIRSARVLKEQILEANSGKITFAFQPIVNTHAGDCFGCEAVLRNYKLVGVENISAFFDHAVDLGVLRRIDLPRCC